MDSKNCRSRGPVALLKGRNLGDRRDQGYRRDVKAGGMAGDGMG